MKSRTAKSDFSLWCRQLSVVTLMLVTGPAFGQPSAGAMQGILTQQQTNAYLAIPQDTRGVIPMFASQMSAIVIQKPDKWFADFKVNDDMSMGLVYNYRFSFDFGMQTRKGTKIVPNGLYRITVASFIKAEPNARMPDRVPPNETLEQRFVTVSPPITVMVRDGKVSQDIALRFDNATNTVVRNTIYVEFTPLGCPTTAPCVKMDAKGQIDTRQSDLKPLRGYSQCLITAPWVPSDLTLKGDCTPEQELDEESKRLQQTGLAQFANQVITARQIAASVKSPATLSPREYAAKYHLAYIDINDPALLRFGRKWLNRDVRQILGPILSNYTAKPILLPAEIDRLPSMFCDLIHHANLRLPPNWRTEECAMADGLPIYMRRNLHVARVNTQKDAVYVYNQPFKNVLTRNLTSGRSRDESVSTSISTKLGAIFGLGVTGVGLVDPTGFILKAKAVLDIADASHAVSWSNSRNRNENDGNSMQMYMDVTPTVLEFDAFQVQSCFEVKTDFTQPIVQIKNRTLGYYICGPTVPRAKIQEFYVNAYSRMAPTSTVDPYARSAQAVNYSIRGDRETTLFYQKLHGRLGPDPTAAAASLAGISWPDSQTVDVVHYFNNLADNEKNIVSTPVLVKRTWEPPSFAAKMIGNYEEKFDF